jgi:TonB family protein
MKNCGKCGAENRDHARICDQCGAKFEPVEDMPDTGEAPMDDSVSTEPPSRHKRHGRLVVFVAVLLVAVAGGLWQNYAEEPQNADEPEQQQQTAEPARVDSQAIQPTQPAPAVEPTQPAPAAQQPSRSTRPQRARSSARATIGQRDQAAVEAQANKARSVISGCYTIGLAVDPELAGSLVVRFTIATDGKVKDVTVSESDIDNDDVEGCVVAVVRTWKFASGQSAVTLEYPFTFEPG